MTEQYGDYRILGRKMSRVDARLKATGQARYAGDLEKPDMLWCWVKRSPYPHARILNIDTSKAEKVPGVKAIITGKDFNGFRWGWSRDTRDEDPLAVEKVRYLDEGVAAVAAIDEDTAQEACDLIEVEYEVLPGVFDPFEAMAEGAPLVHDNRPGNVCVEYHWNFGDVEKAFNESYFVIEDTFQTPRMAKGYVEPSAGLCYWPDDKHVVYEASKGSPYFPYRILSNCFNLPLSNVRIIQPFIGCDFGGTKNDMVNGDFSTCMLAKITGKPVKFQYTQYDELTTCLRRHPMWVTMKVGVNKEGLLTATKIDLVSDGGAYTRMSPLTHFLSGICHGLPYHLPNYKYDAVCYFTNNCSSAAMRGHGIYHTRFAGDVLMDMIAEKLGMDPIDIRIKNSIDNPKPGTVYKTINDVTVGSCGMKECFEEIKEARKWKEERNKQKKAEDYLAYGTGYSGACYNGGTKLSAHNSCAAIIRVCEDGSINYLTGASDVGQGSDTVCVAIAAEVIGVNIEDIDIKRVDTAHTPVDPGSYGSRVTVLAGQAAKVAAEDTRRQLIEVAAKLLNAKEDEVDIQDKKAFLKSNPEQSIPWIRLIRAACYDTPGKVIIGRGYSTQGISVYGLADFSKGIGDIGTNYSFSAQASEVEVDVETGVVTCTENCIMSHDCGFPLNPIAVETQVLGGGYHQGIAAALYEEFKMDKGQTMNPNFVDYKRPRAYEAPDTKVKHVVTIDPFGPYGAKEASEGTCCTAPPAIINAIYDATGVWIKNLPAEPEKVFWALKAKRDKEKNKK